MMGHGMMGRRDGKREVCHVPFTHTCPRLFHANSGAIVVPEHLPHLLIGDSDPVVAGAPEDFRSWGCLSMRCESVSIFTLPHVGSPTKS